MTLKELVDAIFDDFVEQTEKNHKVSKCVKCYKKLRKKWLKKIKDAAKYEDTPGLPIDDDDESPSSGFAD